MADKTPAIRTPIRTTKGSPEADAKGQSEKNHKGGTNDGVSSANPRVLSGNEDGDATFPLQRK
ncbi:hypothetical protein ACFX5Q_32465 [Mesorhizobium sp. IMUNJ 23033]|uniref:hypothetical protein n=1 Tax=Mesorhizobium sp. IMUNJ 23033 TaxID=3378039 RepID=UPI00384B84E0